MKLPIPPRARPYAAVALCLAISVLAAVASVSSISLLPPRITPLELQIAGAGTRVIVDNQRSLVSDDLASDGDYQSLHRRSVLMANLMTSEPVRGLIAARAGIDRDRFVGRTRVTANVQAVLTEPNSERRASTIADASTPYRLEVQPDPVKPTMNIYSQAPTVAEAVKIADSAILGLRDYLRETALRNGADPAVQVRLEQPSLARGGVINGGAKIQIAGLTFIFALLVSGMGILVAVKLRRDWRGTGKALSGTTDAHAEPQPAIDAAPDPQPSPGGPALRRTPRVRPVMFSQALTAGPSGAIALPRTRTRTRSHPVSSARRAALRAGDWPRTTRVLPWMLAVMMAVVWLVPFNVIQLTVSLPVDLKFDRLVLPFVIATWVLALAAGGRGAPKVRMTWIHVAIVAVGLVAMLSLVIEARNLNSTLEFDTAVKKLTLLASYIALFLITASSIRYTEVRPFMKYSLILGLLCAAGTIYEFRFKVNLFYDWSDMLLPSVFEVGEAEAAAVDAIGRRVVRGPGEVPLEAAAMLSLTLPIALVGIMQSTVTRNKILYAMAAAILFAASMSTFRKSGLLAPLAVILTFAYFRRRELLRLAPLGLVMVIFVNILSPGVSQNVLTQLKGDNPGFTTVSDRSSDYDAVRPDVWSHLLVGRGYGSYEHTSYRILDMELLYQLVTVGLLGLLAFVALLLSVIAVARAPIRARGPDAAIGLAAAGSAAAFLVLATLFDEMAFPHCPYIMLWIAGLLAVAVSAKQDDGEDGPSQPDGRSLEARWSS